MVMWLQQFAQSCTLKTLWFPLNYTLQLAPTRPSSPCEASFSLTYYILWVQIIETVLDPAVSPWGFRGQGGSRASPLIQEGGSPWGSDRLTCLAAMIDTLGLVWPLWLTSTGSRLAPVIISGLKCRIGNGGAAAVYSAPFLLDWWITSLSSRKLYLPWVFQSDWVSLCSRATEKQYVLSSSECPRVKWLITGKHILWKMTVRLGQTSSRAHKCH